MLLENHFEKVFTLSSPNRIKNTLHDELVDVVLLDMNFSAGINNGNEGLFWLSEIKKEYPARECKNGSGSDAAGRSRFLPLFIILQRLLPQLHWSPCEKSGCSSISKRRRGGRRP